MADLSTLIMLLAFLAVPVGWLLPRAWAMDGIAALTALVLALVAPVSAACLIASAILVPLVLRLSEKTGARNLVAAALAIIFVALFSAAQFVSGILLVGVGFFTLRHLHVVGDWWMGQLPAPSLRRHLRYQLFLPVSVIGPINRIQQFERQVERRRFAWGEIFEGMERALIGAFMAHTLGSWLVPTIAQDFAWRMRMQPQFLVDWVQSALEWVSLYFVFAGMTGIALGTSLMLGLRLEENFNRPWRATSLLDFWRRWHMTLSNWVLDYVFRPVSAITRNAFIGLVAAMLAIGLWHEYSLYYVLWSFWQVLGIVLTRMVNRAYGESGPPRWIVEFAMPVSVLTWLSLSRPVVSRILELLA
jgi:alginate O-acetyltransferase complex protein AlgI